MEDSSSHTPAADLTGVLPPLNAHPMQTHAKSGIVKPKVWGSFVAENDSGEPISEPLSVKSVLQSVFWKHAVDDEMSALLRNKTWKLAPQPRNLNLIGNKWVFMEKTKSDIV